MLKCNNNKGIFTNTTQLIIINTRPFRAPFRTVDFLNTVALLACTGASDVGDHAVDAEGVGGIFFELHGAVTSLDKCQLDTS